MIVYRGDPSGWTAPEHGSAVAIGVFDGVHLGHRRVLSALQDREEGLTPIAMTFGTHPAALLSEEGEPSRLSTMRRRFDLFADEGIERVAVLDFDEHLRTMTPDEFVRRYLVDGLRTRCVAVGTGFRFGVDAIGTTDTLVALGEALGFRVKVVDIACDDGTEIRSTAIRGAILEGDVVRAAAMLGRFYELEGIVVPGDGRGRRLGVPTANVSFPATLAIPRHGVYAVTVSIDGVERRAVANLGLRPTFGSQGEVLEVHVLGLDQDLYGKQLAVKFIGRIRDEEKFASVDELLAQIHRDIATAEGIFDDQVS